MRMRSEFTVLVVEDEFLLRMDLTEQLRGAGWSTQEAETGEAALAFLAQDDRIDFLITDIRLGGVIDGWRVAERFREIHPDGMVVYVSANPDLAARRVKDSIFLGKPVDVRMVLSICDRLTSKD